MNTSNPNIRRYAGDIPQLLAYDSANDELMVIDKSAKQVKRITVNDFITNFLSGTLNSAAAVSVGTAQMDLVTGDDVQAAIDRIDELLVGANREYIRLDIGDETTPLTTGTNKFTFRMPHLFTLESVRASVTTAPTDADLIIDINEAGVSVLGDKLSIDAGEKTSQSATTPATITDPNIADDGEITIDINQVGSTIAGAGLKITLIGSKSLV